MFNFVRLSKESIDNSDKDKSSSINEEIQVKEEIKNEDFCPNNTNKNHENIKNTINNASNVMITPHNVKNRTILHPIREKN